MRKQVRRDAFSNGWLRRWGQGKRTSRGELLLQEIRDFRRELRTLAAAGDAAAMTGLAPYAMIFGLARAASPRLADGDSAGTGPRDHDDDVPWAQAGRVAQGFAEACGRSSPIQAWVTTPADDFAHSWSAPHGQNHGHGHGQSYGEPYEGHMGGERPHGRRRPRRALTPPKLQ